MQIVKKINILMYFFKLHYQFPLPEECSQPEIQARPDRNKIKS